MDFDESYFKAREDAVRWLRRDYDRRDYREGITLLERMRFKPLLTRRLKQCEAHPPMMRILVQAVTDGVNVYRNPTAPKFADTIPAEVEEATGGTLPPAPDEEESEEGDTSRPSPLQPQSSNLKPSTYPENVRRVVRWYADAYKRRDRLHREMRAVGESNDNESMARRKVLSDRIDTLTDYMDAIYPLKEAYHADGSVPTEEQLAAIGTYDVWESRHPTAAADNPAASQQAASFRKKEEDFASMDIDELRTRRSSIRTMLTRKQNQLLYQSDKCLDKENPMPDSPRRTRLEKQVEALKEKLYQADKAMAKFG